MLAGILAATPVTGGAGATGATRGPTPVADPALAFEAFFERHHRELNRLAYTLTGDRSDADEVTGDAFAAVWQNWARVSSATHPPAYVRRMVVNLAAGRVRRAERERRGAALLAAVANPFDPGPDVAGAVDLQAAVLRLPLGQRSCVVLRHVLDLPEHEVAWTLGISVGTVKSQTSKALARIRSQLAPPAGRR